MIGLTWAARAHWTVGYYSSWIVGQSSLVNSSSPQSWAPLPPPSLAHLESLTTFGHQVIFFRTSAMASAAPVLALDNQFPTDLILVASLISLWALVCRHHWRPGKRIRRGCRLSWCLELLNFEESFRWSQSLIRRFERKRICFRCSRCRHSGTSHCETWSWSHCNPSWFQSSLLVCSSFGSCLAYLKVPVGHCPSFCRETCLRVLDSKAGLPAMISVHRPAFAFQSQRVACWWRIMIDRAPTWSTVQLIPKQPYCS